MPNLRNQSLAKFPDRSIRVLVAIISTACVIETSSNYFNTNSNLLIDFTGYTFQAPLALLGLINYSLILAISIVPMFPGLFRARRFLIAYTWWGLLLLSFGTTIFNIILIGLIYFKINFVSFSSLFSAFISSILFVIALNYGHWKKTKELIIQLIVFAFGVAFGSLIWITSFNFEKAIHTSKKIGIPTKVESSSNVHQIGLAKFLKAKGFVLYSLHSCPYSKSQKELFGKEAVNELSIVECTDNKIISQPTLCGKKGIKGFPAWEFNGKLNIGTKSLRDLAEISGYNIKHN
tara:strand:+ start:504 stop:1376 length:873 start_codon:yes stop_codon:yes gene_type:complete